jgi:ubiquinone/menaquinone biosynthesis C-methylase UbiE
MKLSVFLTLLLFGGADKKEVAMLADALQWKSGSHVADIGAGDGDLAIEAARIVGPNGIVYATELDQGKLRGLQEKQKKFPNLRAIAAKDSATGLPADCCESAYMRGVYHHIQDPAAFNASLFAALKPGARLAVIDFTSNRFLSLFFPVKGVPANRGGHGVPLGVVVEELKRAGFQIERQIAEWPHGHYCVIARKP